MTRKIGIITTGQSPRNEYRSFHKNALEAMGLKVEILERACLDGLTRPEIAAHEITPENGLGIGCYVHNTTPDDRRMGSGWEEVFVDQAWYLQRCQAAVDAHIADGVELIMMCCAEMYPEGALKSSVPLVLPYQLMFDLVRRQAAPRASYKLALLLPTPWHIEQDKATWRSQEWMSTIDVHFGVGIPDGRAAAQLKDEGPYDLALIWGYGDGLALHDPDTMLADISAALGCPTVTPNILNILQARLLLLPALPERTYVRH